MFKKYNFLLFSSLLVVFVVAFTNAYIVNLKGAEIDAERFLDEAINWARFGHVELVVDAEFFIQFLGLLVYAFGFDEFILTSVGVLFYFYSIAFLFYRHRNVPSPLNGFVFVVVCYFVLFSPSLILRIGALLREPYVIFALVMMIYHAVSFIERKKLEQFLFVLLYGLFGALFHKAMLAFLPVFLLVLSLFTTNKSLRSWLMVGGVFVIFVVLAVFLFPTLGSLRGGSALSVMMTGDFSTAERIVDYKASREFRTTYDYGKDFSSLTGVILTIIKANLYYYLSPFPWKVTSFVDLFALAESWLRVMVIGGLFLFLKKEPNRSLAFVLVCYVLLNTIWAVGTSNYGTATRHHITTTPLLLYGLILVMRNRKIHSLIYSRI